MPYSGPASGYSAQGKVQSAYYNDDQREGRRERAQAQISATTMATARPRRSSRRASSSSRTKCSHLRPARHADHPAIHKYMNQKKVPHLFISTRRDRWNDPKNYPWTVRLSLPHDGGEGRRALHPADEA